MAYEYEVFICFRGLDTLYGFVSHLQDRLRKRGFKVYYDKDPEKGSTNISGQLMDAMTKSKAFLVVFSENFASSTWCLEELRIILEQRSKYGKIVVPIFFGVDPSDVRYATGKFGAAFGRHKPHKEQEKIQGWRNALIETSNLSGWNSRDVRDDATLVDEIVRDIEKRLWQSSRMKARIEWTMVIVNCILEIPSAVFDQLSSARKPLYALVGMLISLLSVMFCVSDLIYRGRAERVQWRWSWPVPWFHYCSPSSKRFGSFADIIGLVCVLCQCIVTIINYSFIEHGADSPIKLQVWPMIFAFGLVCSKIMESPQKRAVR